MVAYCKFRAAIHKGGESGRRNQKNYFNKKRRESLSKLSNKKLDEPGDQTEITNSRVNPNTSP